MFAAQIRWRNAFEFVIARSEATWQSRSTQPDNRVLPANTAALRDGASRTPPPTRRVRSAGIPGNLQLPKALTERRYRRNRLVRFYRHLVRTGSAFPRLPRRFAPRNDTSGEREVHQRPPTVELLPTRRSLSAATGPVGGGCHLTIACANRLCSTGPGCPLPYKARPEACLLFILHFSVFSIHFFTYAPLQRRVHVSPETKSPPGFPEGIAFYRGMAGTASISCRRFESEMSFRGHTAAQRPQETHLE